MQGPGLRGLPHRPALPRGRHQRRLPVPARPRGRRRRRGGRRGRHRRRARRLRHPQLARRVRPVPGLRQGQAVVLLQHPQRHAEDDADRRHRAVAGARHRRLRREDAGRRRPVHQGRPRGRPGRGRPARLRRDGRLRRRDQHRRRRPRRLASPSSAAAASATPRSPAPRSPARRTIIAVDIDDRKLEWAKQLRRHAHRQQHGAPTRSRRSAALTGGFGADVVIEAVGRPETYEQAFYARDLAGTVVLVGVPDPRHDGRRCR